VTSAAQHVLVLAGPGSGKTRVLTHRIAHLIRSCNVQPFSIIAVTFTNKAAKEMGARLESLLEGQAEGVWLGTFHAICARILRREANLLAVNANFVIMDADDQLALVRRVLKELNLDEKLYRPQAIHATISNAKNMMIWPEDFSSRSYRDEVAKRVYKRYNELLQTNNALDFDDLLLWTVRLLDENPAVRERYARRFDHLLVDEFQDTNAVQYTLLKLLAALPSNCLFVVGDEDQSIYRWRGADYRNVLRFEEDYPTAEKVLLEQNYRSTQTVLEVARAVIDRNLHRTPKHLFSDRGRGDRVIVYDAADDRAEAAYVVDTVRQWLTGGKAKGGDFAIMYRTNAQSRLLEEAFLHAGMAYRLVGAQRFYGRREVKDMIAYLRLVENPADELSLLRAINTPPRGIGDKTILALQLAARQASLTAGDVLLELGREGQNSPHWKALGGRGAVVLSDFGALMVNWLEMRDQATLPALFDRIVADIVYQPYIEDGSEEGSDRWGNVQELRKLAYEYQERGLTAFLESLALVSDQDTLPDQASAPTLLTLHAAKGLEFKQVFITGLDEGLMPHSRSKDDPEEMEEERRLFYVGLTRAKDRLYLLRARSRASYGSVEYQEPSRFLEDIPAEFVTQQQGTRSSFSSGSSRSRHTSTDDDIRWDRGTTTTSTRWQSQRAET
ncbi:MAG TPA: UvrD-helicase domain-containing protein, partial [Anaerolineaceae bacterium]|nr:UvrD-helicase domain-containing protein [Anaerolineaceae bacterium]